MKTLSKLFGGFDDTPLVGGTDEWRFIVAVAVASEIDVAREEVVA